jgi:toxin FitB
MLILDTNVVSAMMRNVPDHAVEAWLDRQPITSIWTTTFTIFEIQVGLNILPPGKKHASLAEGFARLLDRMDHRIAVFDEPAAQLAADLSAVRQRSGRVGEIRDTMIAGIVLAHRATLATRNVSHFTDISAKVVNPWKD